MELDEMKAAWQLLDRRLERQEHLNLLILSQGKLNAARRALSPLRSGQVVQIVAGACLMLLAGPFWVSHRNTLHLMLPGLWAHIYGLLMVLSAGRTLYLMGRLDDAAPLLENQRRLVQLRLWRARVEQPFFAVIGCFLWIPLTLVVFETMGADLWMSAPWVVYGLIASGFACLAVFYAIKRWMPAQLENSFAGSSIRNAQQQMDEISVFEQE
jgi:drug/metabolite transporter (DMT)-like permease